MSGGGGTLKRQFSRNSLGSNSNLTSTAPPPSTTPQMPLVHFGAFDDEAPDDDFLFRSNKKKSSTQSKATASSSSSSSMRRTTTATATSTPSSSTPMESERVISGTQMRELGESRRLLEQISFALDGAESSSVALRRSALLELLEYCNADEYIAIRIQSTLFLLTLCGCFFFAASWVRSESVQSCLAH